ncbi:hypothetical protein JCM8202_001176 [Rhodotorula sphaerocarpa]
MEAQATASTSASPLLSQLPSSLSLSPKVVSSFKPAKVFKGHNAPQCSFTSLDFDDRGDWLITAGEDESMQLFDVRTGKHQKQLYSKKYGVHLARFTHKSSTVIYASTKENDDIRYLSLHDNNYLRYFKGHKKRVVSLAMSPQDDTFLSAAHDDTVRFWDLRAPTAQGLLNIAGHPCVAYDPTGTVFAVALNLRSTIMMYAMEAFDKQPFLCVHLDDPVLGRRLFPPRVPVMTSLSFSNDGKWLLVGTSGDVHYVLDSFDGSLLARLEMPEDQIAIGLERARLRPFDRPMTPAAGISSEEVKWSSDARYVISGSIDGRVLIWDFAPPASEAATLYPNRPAPGKECTLHPIAVLDGHPNGPSRAVAFNPRSAMMASAGFELSFWLPDLKQAGIVKPDEEETPAPPAAAATAP